MNTGYHCHCDSVGVKLSFVNLKQIRNGITFVYVCTDGASNTIKLITSLLFPSSSLQFLFPLVREGFPDPGKFSVEVTISTDYTQKHILLRLYSVCSPLFIQTIQAEVFYQQGYTHSQLSELQQQQHSKCRSQPH